MSGTVVGKWTSIWLRWAWLGSKRYKMSQPVCLSAQARYVWSPIWKRSMTICWNSQSGDHVNMIGSLGWLGAMFVHTIQVALILQIEASISGQYTDSLACAFMPTTPWCAECRQCRTFLHCVLGITIFRSNNTKPLSVLRRCLTSQYSQTLGAVRLHVLAVSHKLVFHIVDHYDPLPSLGLVISWLYYCCLQPAR